MGLFSKRQAPEPVRRNQVMRLAAAVMRETDAADRDIDSPEREKEWRKLNRLYDSSTQAEIRAAHEAADRAQETETRVRAAEVQYRRRNGIWQ